MNACAVINTFTVVQTKETHPLGADVLVLDESNVSGRETHAIPFVWIEIEARKIHYVVEVVGDVDDDLWLKYLL